MYIKPIEMKQKSVGRGWTENLSKTDAGQFS